VGGEHRATTVGLALGLWSALVWGGQFIVVKGAYAHVGPTQINAIRYVPIALILLAILARVEGRGALRAGGHGRLVVLLGIGVLLFNDLNYVGLDYTRPQNASLISALTPLVAVLLLWGITGARPRAATFALVGVALVGVVLVISRGDPGGYLDEGAHWGDLLCILGVGAFAAYTIGVGRATTISPLRLTALSSLVSMVLMIAVAVVAAAVGFDPYPSARDLVAATPAILYIAIPGAVIAMLAWNRSARLIGGQNTALLMNLVPITVLVIELIRGYEPAALEYVGAALVLAAVTTNNLLLRRDSRAARIEAIAAESRVGA